MSGDVSLNVHNCHISKHYIATIRDERETAKLLGIRTASHSDAAVIIARCCTDEGDLFKRQYNDIYICEARQLILMMNKPVQQRGGLDFGSLPPTPGSTLLPCTSETTLL